MNKIYKIYTILFKKYGAQGWWPYMNFDGVNGSKMGNIEGYHIGDYSYPKNNDQIFEVALGSILTQNTTFTSVIKAMKNLNTHGGITKDHIKALSIVELKNSIRPAGYFNQKANYILNYIEFYESLDSKVPTRDEVLKVKGVGEETADSILLYGYNQAEFKIDAYTKRLLLELELIDQKAKYKDMKNLMESSLKQITTNKQELRIIYQEYHALIVEHGKRYYSKKPYGVGCFLKNQIKKD
jgi:endonuclease-3 related protein